VNFIATAPELPPRIKTPNLEERKNGTVNLVGKRVNQPTAIAQNILRVRVAPERQNPMQILITVINDNCPVIWQWHGRIKSRRHVVGRGKVKRPIPGTKLLTEVCQLAIFWLNNFNEIHVFRKV